MTAPERPQSFQVPHPTDGRISAVVFEPPARYGPWAWKIFVRKTRRGKPAIVPVGAKYHLESIEAAKASALAAMQETAVW